MTSRDSSSDSRKETPQPPLTYEGLLGNSENWRPVEALLRDSPHREAFRSVLLAERAEVMEQSLLSDSDDERRAGKHIVLWIDGFLNRDNDLQQEWDAKIAAADAPEQEGGSPWMEPDGGSTETPEYPDIPET